MILPYYMRLLCLCLATFFVVHTVGCLMVCSVARAMVSMAAAIRPRVSSRLLFALRMAPAAITVFVVVGFCVPSYIWMEPHVQNERVGLACLLAATLGGMGWAVSLLRGSASVLRTAYYVRECGLNAEAIDPGDGLPDVLLVEDGAAVMAVAGVLRPRLMASRSVMDTLSREEKEVALRHELAHRESRDNLKKLLILLSPDLLPFTSGLATLERGWSRFAEWAADDAAVSGDALRALSLASALVRVARLGVHPAPAHLLSSLAEADRDLEMRVERLLSEPAYAERALQPLLTVGRNAMLLCGGLTVAVLLWPGSLGGIHRLLEHLVQ